MPNLKEATLSRGTLYNLDPRMLKPKTGLNPRDYDAIENAEHINELYNSIKEIGVKQPLTVINEEGEILITDGECRWRAVMKLIKDGTDIKSIPCKAEEKYANDIDKAYAPIILNMGKPLSQLEQGKLYKRLVNLGETTAGIAKRTGKSLMHIENCLTLFASPKPIHDFVKHGEVSPTLATQTIRSEGVKASIATLTEAVGQAKASGKAKATAKDVEAVHRASSSRQPSILSAGQKLKIVARIIEESFTSEYTVENEDQTTSLTFAKEDIMELMEVLEI